MIPFPNCPERPLRALGDPDKPHQYHNHAYDCSHNWVHVPGNKMTDEQIRMAAPWRHDTSDIPDYTPGCPGCNALIAWHQHQRYHYRLQNNLTQPHTQGRLFS